MIDPRILLLIAVTMILPATANEPMRMCGQNERNTPAKHCVTDGDTIWNHGVQLRLKDFDTPEPNPGNSNCEVRGTAKEEQLADMASARLLELLNTNDWTVETFSRDSTGRRYEATISIEGRDVGDILIAEGLATPWPDGELFWC
jgi:micrococcal nuclease